MLVVVIVIILMVVILFMDVVSVRLVGWVCIVICFVLRVYGELIVVIFVFVRMGVFVFLRMVIVCVYLDFEVFFVRDFVSWVVMVNVVCFVSVLIIFFVIF